MTPGDPLYKSANTLLLDPNFRDSIRQMHAEGYPFLKMIDALGLEDDMSDRVRKIVEGLPDDVVADIRRAVLAMLDSEGSILPLRCTMSSSEIDAAKAVDVSVDDVDGRPTIHVRARTGT